MAKKKLYRTIIQLEVITEEPLEQQPLARIAFECDNGDYSGYTNWKVTNQPIKGKKAAKLVIEQGSDLDFFQMDENGNEI